MQDYGYGYGILFGAWTNNQQDWLKTVKPNQCSAKALNLGHRVINILVHDFHRTVLHSKFKTQGPLQFGSLSCRFLRRSDSSPDPKLFSAGLLCKLLHWQTFKVPQELHVKICEVGISVRSPQQKKICQMCISLLPSILVAAPTLVAAWPSGICMHGVGITFELRRWSLATQSMQVSSHIRWFPKIGLPLHHPFLFGISHYKPTILGGDPSIIHV